MKTSIYWAVALIQLILLSSFCHAVGKDYKAGTLTLNLAGRGLYQEAAVALYNDRILTLNAPETAWLADMKDDDLASLKDFDPNNLAELSTLLSKGIKKTKVPVQFSLEYSGAQGGRFTRVLPVIDVKTKDGNMQYRLAHSVSLPQEIENVVMLIKTWPLPARISANTFHHSVCCECNDGCAALWSMFSYCDSCESYRGASYCCHDCKKPAEHGQSCSHLKK